MKPIRIDQFYKGQEASKYFAGIADTQNIEVFDELGTARCADGWESLAIGDNGNLFCIANDNGYQNIKVIMFNCGSSNDRIYLFKNDGIVTDITGDYSGGTVFGCAAFSLIGKTQPYVYFATHTHLYSITYIGSSNVITEIGAFLDPTLTRYQRPMVVHGLDLYIGAGQYVASVDGSGVFTNNALDLDSNSDILCLTSYGSDLLIGGSYHNTKGFVTRYDTFSESFYALDLLSEQVVSFSTSDNSNIVFALVGKSGAIFYYNGNTLAFYKTTHEKLSDNDTSHTESYRTAMYLGRIIFARARYQAYKIYSLSQAFPNSTFGLTAIDDGPVDCLENNFDDKLFKLSNGDLFVLSSSQAKSDASITTNLINKKVDSIKVGYQDIPTGTSINIYIKADNASTWTLVPSVDDSTDAREVGTNKAIGNARTLQVKVELVPNGDKTPIIEYIDIL